MVIVDKFLQANHSNVGCAFVDALAMPVNR